MPFALSGIRRENPGISEAESLEILRKRLEWAEQTEARVLTFDLL
jgi:hypothetical protein